MKRKLTLLIFVLSLFTYISIAQQPYVYRILQPVGGASVTGNTGFINTQGTGSTYASLSWTINGSLATCTVQMDFSNDGSTVAGQLISAQTCTSNGSIIAGATSTPSYVRVSYVIGTGGGYINFVGQGCTGATCTSGGGGGSGTVTTVSVVNANGVSGAVANPTTTPAITVSLGAITPSSVAATGTISGSSVSSNSDGIHPSFISFIGNTTQPAVAANTVGFMGPTITTFTGYSLQFPSTSPSGGQVLQFGTPSTGIATGTWITPGGGAFPLTITGGVSGGIPCFTSTTVEAASGILNSNILIKGSGAGVCPTNSLFTDTGTTATYTGTGGVLAPIFTSNGSTAGFIDLPQGTTSSAVAPCNTVNSHCIQAPTAVTTGLETDAPALAQGVPTRTGVAATIQDGYSGDANHSATVSISTATSIGSTSLCSSAICLVGTYRVSAYIDVTTACTTTGTYFVSIIYTDDTTVSKTEVMPLIGTGVTATLLGPTAITSSLGMASTTNYATGSMILRSTGATSINYSTTAGACGTGGPGVGKMYLVVEPIS